MKQKTHGFERRSAARFFFDSSLQRGFCAAPSSRVLVAAASGWWLLVGCCSKSVSHSQVKCSHSQVSSLALTHGLSNSRAARAHSQSFASPRPHSRAHDFFCLKSSLAQELTHESTHTHESHCLTVVLSSARELTHELTHELHDFFCLKSVVTHSHSVRVCLLCCSVLDDKLE